MSDTLPPGPQVASILEAIAGLTFVGLQQPIGCGVVAVFPNDVVVVDEDGAVCIPQTLVNDVVAPATDQELTEGWIMQEVGRGVPLPELYPMNAETKARYETWRKSKPGLVARWSRRSWDKARAAARRALHDPAFREFLVGGGRHDVIDQGLRDADGAILIHHDHIRENRDDATNGLQADERQAGNRFEMLIGHHAFPRWSCGVRRTAYESRLPLTSIGLGRNAATFQGPTRRLPPQLATAALESGVISRPWVCTQPVILSAALRGHDVRRMSGSTFAEAGTAVRGRIEDQMIAAIDHAIRYGTRARRGIPTISGQPLSPNRGTARKLGREMTRQLALLGRQHIDRGMSLIAGTTAATARCAASSTTRAAESSETAANNRRSAFQFSLRGPRSDHRHARGEAPKRLPQAGRGRRFPLEGADTAASSASIYPAAPRTSQKIKKRYTQAVTFGKII